MMLKIAMFDQDNNYQNRLFIALRDRYSDCLEVILCNSEDEILELVESQNIDLLVINQMLDYDLTLIKRECAIARFVEFNNVTEYEGKPAICKYQKVSDIYAAFEEITKQYKEELAIRIEQEKKEEEERLERERKAEEERLERERKAEEERLRQEQLAKEEEERKRKEEEERQEALRKAEEERLIARRSHPDIQVYLSVQQKEGSTVASMACAASMVSHDRNVLYINLKQEKNTGDILKEDSLNFGLKDIIEKANDESLDTDNLKNVIRKSELGFDYIPSNNSPYELMKLKKDGLNKLIETASALITYDAIVINIDTYITETNFEALMVADKVIFVGSGFKESNAKLIYMYNRLKSYDEMNQSEVYKKVSILYNKYINKKCSIVNLEGVVVLGGINAFNANNPLTVIEKMKDMTVFSQLENE